MTRPPINTRRTFLRQAGLAAAAGMLQLPPFFRTLLAENEDEALFRQKISWAMERHLEREPLGTIIADVGRSFLGTPYVAHSLEGPGDEHLVVNLRAFDCVTFVESTLAIARCLRSGKTAFADYTRELQALRYRDGVIRGYPSRLHYFTDWIRDNERKKLVRDVTRELGGESVKKIFNIMSTHRADYPRLSDDAVYRDIRAAEERLSETSYAVIPRDKVAAAEPGIKNGDIIALATSIAGVDVSHTGLAVVSDGTVHYLHAPLSGGKVSLSPETLARYVRNGSRTLTGIVVARPLEP